MRNWLSAACSSRRPWWLDRAGAAHGDEPIALFGARADLRLELYSGPWVKRLLKDFTKIMERQAVCGGEVSQGNPVSLSYL